VCYFEEAGRSVAVSLLRGRRPATVREVRPHANSEWVLAGADKELE
jgi:hypothetical protein